MASSDVEFVRALTAHVIARLGDDAPRLRILEIGYSHGLDEESLRHVITDEPSEHITLWLGVGGTDKWPIGATFTLGVPLQDAIAATAEHIQVGALEMSGGALLPPCPGHRHPLQINLIDGVACWECPHDRAHYVEPVFPSGTESR